MISYLLKNKFLNSNETISNFPSMLYCVFTCLSNMISSIFGKSFHFPYPKHYYLVCILNTSFLSKLSWHTFIHLSIKNLELSRLPNTHAPIAHTCAKMLELPKRFNKHTFKSLLYRNSSRRLWVFFWISSSVSLGTAAAVGTDGPLPGTLLLPLISSLLADMEGGWDDWA